MTAVAARAKSDAAAARAATQDATTAHLLPFLVLLATAMVTSAASAGNFDVAYPLRVIAVLGVLWWLRATYVELRLGRGAVDAEAEGRLLAVGARGQHGPLAQLLRGLDLQRRAVGRRSES